MRPSILSSIFTSKRKSKSVDERIRDVDTDERTNRIVERRYKKVDRKYEKANGDKDKEEAINKKFGYNYKSAREGGVGPDSTGHWPSIRPDTGEILKAPRHPSMIKTKKVEKILGNKIVRVGDKLYSVPKK